MSNMFGGGDNGAAEAKAAARKNKQDASESEQRSKQLAERGGGLVRNGRNLLMGELSKSLPMTLGGSK